MKNSLRLNSLYLLFARVAAHGSSFLFIVIVARRLDIESFGQFSFIAALVFVGNTVTTFGTDTYIIREIAHSQKISDDISRALALQLFLSTLWILFTFFMHEPLLVVYSLALIPLAFNSVIGSTFRAFERMNLSWSISLANGFVQVVAALLSHDIKTLILAQTAGIFLLAGFVYWMGSASLPDFRLFPLKSFFLIFKMILPFATLTIFLVLSQRLGVLAVSTLMGDASTGIFSSVARIVDGLKLGHYAILGALLPVISRGTQESKQSFRKGFMLLLLASLLAAICLTIFSRFIILILYGEKFASAISLLPILGWGLIPYTVSSFISYDLIAHRLEITSVKVTTISLVIYVVLYLWLIPLYNLNGAIYAALAGEILQAVIFVIASLSSAKSKTIPNG